MNWGSLILCGWPGLPNLWYRGKVSSLAFAALFALLLNIALISTFIWPRLLGEFFPVISWTSLILIWTISLGVAFRTFPQWSQIDKIAGPDDVLQSDPLFFQAQKEYLKGDWDKTEKILRKCLEIWPRDIEARLLLATLLRHTRRLYEACEELDNLLKIDESINWINEIRSEQKLIQLIAADSEPESVP